MFTEPDPRTKDWYYFNSPVPVVLILTSYLYFSARWGVEYMKYRNRLNLREIIILYDSLQVIGCFCITVRTFFIIAEIDWRCGEIKDSADSATEPVILAFYHFLKVMDLFETVFHVLHKRDDTLTIGHFYHHIMMVILTWVAVRYAPSGHTMFLPFTNSAVSIFKYATYLSTAYYRSKGRCLFWRNNNQKMQFVEFGITFYIFLQPLFTSGCSFPKEILLVGLLQVIVLVFFTIYYNLS